MAPDAREVRVGGSRSVPVSDRSLEGMLVAAAIRIASRASQAHEADTTGRARKWKPIRCVDPDQAQRRKGASPLVQLQMRRTGRGFPGLGTARRPVILQGMAGKTDGVSSDIPSGADRTSARGTSE
jgi:hypothetical protein